MKIELKILDLLARDTSKNPTINEIAKATKEYYSFVHRTISKLTKEGVITKTKVGKAFICSLNLNNEKTIILLQLNEIERKSDFFQKNKELQLILEDFVKSLEPKRDLSSVVLFGSYSKENATKQSDIDILIINRKGLNIEKTTKEIYAKYGKEINPIAITPNDFKNQKKGALIREIINNHLTIYGANKFIELVFR
ncbi:MAG: nucleotidyltransferase domain-containing protein [Nanoarchaeota archaeon]|nr:nucleotidyltransferase domain-containing protein [Nanoarchaeota archaeon]